MSCKLSFLHRVFAALPRQEPHDQLEDQGEKSMRLYDGGRAPSPRRVRIFLAEKGIDIPKVPVDLGKMEQKDAGFREVNPMQRVPGSRARRRHGDLGDDGDLALLRDAASRAEFAGPRCAGSRENRDVESPHRARSLYLCASGVSPHPSGDGRYGKAADRGLGGGQQAARIRISGSIRPRTRRAGALPRSTALPSPTSRGSFRSTS